jgi:hypothetical protein
MPLVTLLNLNGHFVAIVAPMTTLSPINAANALAPLYDTSVTKTPSSTQADSGSAPQSSTSVTLGQVAANAQFYAFPSVPVFPPPVWEGPSNNAVSALMATNFSSLSGAQQFQGLGAALLNQFGSNAGDFSQSVLTPGANSSPNAIAAAQSRLHSSATNQITLEVTTTSGAQVDITLGSDSNGLAVQVDVTHGSLSASDRSALEGLSKSFQSAIDGLTANPPTLDLGGLMQFDSSAISSIDFHASVQGATGPQTVDFHADNQVRKLSASGPDGTINLSVNLKDTMIIGDAQQQANAISSYLQQFQNEQTRGNGNPALMSMFDDAFTEMNSNYNVATPQERGVSALLSTLTGADQSVLTGLADFTASVVQTPKASNPYRPNEADTFSYQVSQTTDVDNSNPLNLSVTQRQSSHLSASFHQAVPNSGGLHLTSSKESQTYDYVQVDDSASSEAQIGYQKGLLVKATLAHSASQSTHKQEYVQGELTQNTTTPASQSWSKDFLTLLGDAQLGARFVSQQAVDHAQSTLLAINRLVVLQSNPLDVETTAAKRV